MTTPRAPSPLAVTPAPPAAHLATVAVEALAIVLVVAGVLLLVWRLTPLRGWLRRWAERRRIARSARGADVYARTLREERARRVERG